MKSNIEQQNRWLELLEKHKDHLEIGDIEKVKKAIRKNKNSWAIFNLKVDLLCLEYPLKGESNGKRRTTKNEPRRTDNDQES